MKQETLINANHTILLQDTAAKINTKLEELSSDSTIVFGLCGGRSIVNLLKELRNSEIFIRKYLPKIHFFLVDERLVDISVPESNFYLLNQEFFQNLLKQNLINKDQIHYFPACTQNIQLLLKTYSKDLQKIKNSFDICILGVGEDGHIASLFPNHPSLESQDEYFIEVKDAPKMPAGRMSASLKMLSRSKFLIGLFLGESKKEAFKNFKNNSISITQCPAKILNSVNSLIVSDLNLVPQKLTDTSNRL